jgi:hypothetical protein
MHVWTTPPLRPLTAEDHRYAPLATEIAPDLLHAKLENVTRAVAELSGTRPTVHRAGRYGLDGRGLAVLESLGYTVDTSVTPLLSWREPARDGGWRGPDFTGAPLLPYHPDRHDVTRPGSSPLLEVPVSVFLSRPLPAGVAMRLARLPRNHPVSRALRWTRLVRHAWLRPGREVNGRVLVGVARALIAADVSVLNVMFHSSEMVLGTSPHTRRPRDVADSYAQLDLLFRYLLREAGARSVTLSELAAAFRPA